MLGFPKYANARTRQYHATMFTFAQAWERQGLQHLDIAWWMNEPTKPGYGIHLCMEENAHQSLKWMLSRPEYGELYTNAVWFRDSVHSRKQLEEKLLFSKIQNHPSHVSCLESLTLRLPYMVLTDTRLSPFYPLGLYWHVDHYVRWQLKKAAPYNELATVFYKSILRHGFT